MQAGEKPYDLIPLFPWPDHLIALICRRIL